MSSVIDYTDRTTCVIFGDGAGAVLVEPTQDDEIGLIDYAYEIDGSGATALNMPAGGSKCPASAETIAARLHYVHQDGQAVYKYAVRKMVETSGKVLAANNLQASDLTCFIPHQANKRIILSTAERLGLPLDRVIINIDRFGNTTGGHHSARHADRARRTSAAAERSGPSGVGGCRLHLGSMPAALGNVSQTLAGNCEPNIRGAPYLCVLCEMWVRS